MPTVPLNLWPLLLTACIVPIAWFGLGHALCRLLRLPNFPPILRVAIGAAAILAFAGIAANFNLASRTPLLLLTLVGFLFALRPLFTTRAFLRPHSPFLLPLLAFALILTLYYLSSTSLNPGDDERAYLLFPKQFEQTGTLVSPFNMRRVGTFGGQALLQAQFRAVTSLLTSPANADLLSNTHALLFDGALFPILSCIMLWSLLKLTSPAAVARAALLLSLFLLAPMPHVNIHAQHSATFFFFATALLLRHLHPRNPHAFSIAFVFGILAMAAISFRTHFLSFLPVAFACHLFLSRSARARPRFLLTSCLAFLAGLAFLLPWMCLLYRSSNTPLFPMFPGNVDTSLLIDTSLPFHQHLASALSNLFTANAFPFLLPILIAARLRRKSPALALYLPALFASFLTTWIFTRQGPINAFRLNIPMLSAAAFLTLALAFRRWNAWSPTTRAALLTIALLPPFLGYIHFAVVRLPQSLFLLASLLLAFPLLWHPTPLPLRRLLPFLRFSSALLLLAFLIHSTATLASNSTLLFAVATLVSLALLIRTTPSRPARLAIAAIFTAAALTFLLALTEAWAPISLLPWLIKVAILLLTLYFFFHPTLRTRLLPWLFPIATLPLLLLALLQKSFLSDTLADLFNQIDSPWLLPLFFTLGYLLLSRASTPLVPRILTLLTLAALPLLTHFFPPTTPSDPSIALETQFHYRTAQKSLPPGTTVLSLLPHSVWLDFQRNPIAVVDDDLQNLGPRPHLGSLDSPTILLQYLRTNHIDFLAYDPTTQDALPIPSPTFFATLHTLTLSLPHTSPVPTILLLDLRPSP